MQQDMFKIEHFVVEGLHCPKCIREIEGTLSENKKIKNARVNLSTQRLAVEWQDNVANDIEHSEEVISALDDIGFKAFPFKITSSQSEGDKASSRLLKAMAVAGFAMANVMLLSVAVWDGSEMNESTRSLMHWVSAMIVLPAATYAGMPFFSSAWNAIKGRRLNMDVPISLAVILACGMSLFQTYLHSEETYYDAAVMLLFFLLIGRFLDQKMRNHARSVAHNLMSYKVSKATLLHEDGSTEDVATEMLVPNQVIQVIPGGRIPADGIVVSGTSDIDTSLVTGETVPVKAEKDTEVFAGTININGNLNIKITSTTGNTLLDEIIELMETAEQGRAKYVRLADRAASIYAPLVHALAALTFIGWFFFSTVGWEQSLITAIAVLIITCPCALGLAVPVVQVVASSKLFRSGVLVKAADGMERMAEISTVVFDKTGTLTLGQPELANADDENVSAFNLELAAKLAKTSSHPLCRALIVACHDRDIPTIATDSEIHEEPGMGIKAEINGVEVRLGNRDWCGIPQSYFPNNRYSELWLKAEGAKAVLFCFRDRMRRDAGDVVKWFQNENMKVVLLSGDREDVVVEAAEELGISRYKFACKPQEKIEIIERMKSNGEKVLMVGDGINDAPALSAADVSISPSNAAEVSQNAADFIFQSQKLDSVVRAYQVSVRSRRLVFINFALAAIYNIIAVPFAAAGMLTPLIAALAMSGSSVVVTANALRLNFEKLFESKEA
ncbi:heavy metal translocating P-type ATPase [Pseudemcibacter aquimaris]|uniref:heavy metal translocating P-type ATPase n=1 Tax=Pseudemcibacter aquimaris TaxID=2857064 RepID=UPI002011D9F9|nr:heavy metal translocating P-type ATPase [Pseudemcibacter aquimaris]MCC3862271.1 cadmium-translocating P-type ATPase [Pseudemcibacter aquimaris]WDU59021.1 cadmium-translocating P-type ATPase [Pseudemcibacter aquimaris]